MGNKDCNPSSLVSSLVNSVGGSICIRIMSISVIIPACLQKLKNVLSPMLVPIFVNQLTLCSVLPEELLLKEVHELFVV